MRLFPIINGPHKGKSIHVMRYVKTATGLEIKISHNVPTVAGKRVAVGPDLQQQQRLFGNL